MPQRHLSFFLISNWEGESGSFFTFRTKELCHCQQSPVPKASLKLHLNRDQLRSSEGGLAQTVRVVWPRLSKSASEETINRYPTALATYQHSVVSTVCPRNIWRETHSYCHGRTQWESSVANRSCQNTSWFSVGHKKSNFPLPKYSFCLRFEPLFSWFKKAFYNE